MVEGRRKAGGKARYKLPFETEELRKSLSNFFQSNYTDEATGLVKHIGGFKWGVYLFYDYDGEPIYVGQTKEQVSNRISRHLTNQRTDAVAMSVLDPFEVFRIRVYPLAQFENVNSKHPEYNQAKAYLDALEYAIHQEAICKSKFGAILNEKEPAAPTVSVTVPMHLEGQVVSDQVFDLRSHYDVRIARRSQIIARLAQTISERQVQNGLRRTLVTQAKRLQWLADERFRELGGESAVEKGSEESDNYQA